MWTVKQGTTTQGAAMKKRQNRQIRRLEKVIDELMKIHDDGMGSDATQRMLDELTLEITRRDGDD